MEALKVGDLVHVYKSETKRSRPVFGGRILAVGNGEREGQYFVDCRKAGIIMWISAERLLINRG